MCMAEHPHVVLFWQLQVEHKRISYRRVQNSGRSGARTFLACSVMTSLLLPGSVLPVSWRLSQRRGTVKSGVET